MEDKFLADVHLGRLARMLRMLGFDTSYKNQVTATKELYSTAAAENRILLTRTRHLDSRFLHFLFFTIINEDPELQLKEVVKQFHLEDKINPFSRCMLCNGKLEPVSQEGVLDQLKEKTRNFYHHFWQCNQCGKAYWKGPHYERMLGLMERLGIKTS